MRRLSSASPGPPVSVELDGEPIEVREGESVAMSLLAAGERIFSRSVKYHRPRGAFCLEGSCGQCLMRVDGVPNVYACRTPSRSGMRLERQNAFPSVNLDLLAALDFLFPRGLDHHHLLAGVPLAKEIMTRVARQLAGLGQLPDADSAPIAPAKSVTTRVAVVGSGASGQAAAQALVERRADHVLIEREEAVGGGSHWPQLSASPSVYDAGQLLLDATVLGLYADAGGRFLAVLQTPSREAPRLLKVYADRFVLACGGHPSLLPFEENDVPGVFAASAAARLLRHGLLVGDRPALVGQGSTLHHLARQLREAGSTPSLVLELATELPSDAAPGACTGQPLQALADSQVRALTYRTSDGEQRQVSCDAIVVCMPPAPAFELARQGGASVTYHPELGGFGVDADPNGRTAVPGLFVAGTLVGAPTLEASRASGRLAGGAAA